MQAAVEFISNEFADLRYVTLLQADSIGDVLWLFSEIIQKSILRNTSEQLLLSMLLLAASQPVFTC